MGGGLEGGPVCLAEGAPGFPGRRELEGPGGLLGCLTPRGAASGTLGVGGKFRAPHLPEVWLRNHSQTPTQVNSNQRGSYRSRRWRQAPGSCPTVTGLSSPLLFCFRVLPTDQLLLWVPSFLLFNNYRALHPCTLTSHDRRAAGLQGPMGIARLDSNSQESKPN